MIKRPCSTSVNWVRDVLISANASVSANVSAGVVEGQGQGKIQTQGGHDKDKSKGPNQSSIVDEIESTHKRVKACCGGTLEVTIADTGALQGAVKSAIGKVEASSRLCRRKSAQLFGDLVMQFDATLARPAEEMHNHNQLGSTNNALTQPSALTQPYSVWKLQSRAYQERRQQFLAASSPFSLWIIDDPTTKVTITALTLILTERISTLI